MSQISIVHPAISFRDSVPIKTVHSKLQVAMRTIAYTVKAAIRLVLSSALKN